MNQPRRQMRIGDAVRMLERFGIPATEALALLQARDVPALQARIKVAWKKRAFEAHPDRGGDEEAFKRLAAEYEALMSLRPALPPPAVRVIWFGGGASPWGDVTSASASASADTTTSTVYTWPWGPRRS